MVCSHSHMWFYLCSQCESEEANYFTHNCVLTLLKKEKEKLTKSTKKTLFQSLWLSVIQDWKRKEKKSFLRYFSRLCFYFFPVKVWHFLSILKSILPVCNTFSGLQYSSENLKDWSAHSSWLKFSARLLHDCSSLTIYQYAMSSLQHTFTLYANRWVLRLLLGEDDVWPCYVAGTVVSSLLNAF